VQGQPDEVLALLMEEYGGSGGVEPPALLPRSSFLLDLFRIA
jgi:hypothetical protein